jgi:hypothetical protein
MKLRSNAWAIWKKGSKVEFLFYPNSTNYQHLCYLFETCFAEGNSPKMNVTMSPTCEWRLKWCDNGKNYHEITSRQQHNNGRISITIGITVQVLGKRRIMILSWRLSSSRMHVQASEKKALEQLTTRATKLIVGQDNWRRKNPRQGVGREFVVLWDQLGVLEEEQSRFKANLPPFCM